MFSHYGKIFKKRKGDYIFNGNGTDIQITDFLEMPDQPVFVYDKRVAMLLGTVSLYLLAIFQILLVLDYHLPLVVSGTYHGDLFYTISFCIAFGLLMTYRTFFDSKKVAFYDDHLSISGFLGKINNIPYAELEVKPPVLINPKNGRSSNIYFRRKNTSGKWIELGNPRPLALENNYLYDWLVRKST